MNVGPESIEWEVPKAARDFVRRTCRFVALAPALFAIMAVVQVLQMDTRGWSRFGPIVGFLAFGALLCWRLRRQYVEFMRRKYRLDPEGAHRNPENSCDWSQVSAVSAGAGGVAGTRVLCLRTLGGKEERLVFDPAVLSEERLLGYANAQLDLRFTLSHSGGEGKGA